MSWYSQMMKSQEMARERNRRDARRLESERHGPQFVAKYRIAALDKEKKMIEKELERIRKGVHRQPRLADMGHTKGNHVLTIPSPRLSEHKPHVYAINPEYSKDETKLYDAILFLQNNPSALVPILSAHAQSDAYFETLERVTPRCKNDGRELKSIKPKYLQESAPKTEREELINKYSILLQRQSPELRKNSPLLKRQRNSPVPRRDSPLIHDITKNSPDPNASKCGESPSKGINTPEVPEVVENEVDEKNLVFLTTEEEQSGNTKTSSSTTTPRKSRHPLPLDKLADDGMSTARENVSQRLTGGNDEQSSAERNDQGNDKQDTAAGFEQQKQTEERKIKPKPVAMFPSLDPEVYNADGSVRTCFNMPSFEDAFAEAKKARYVRASGLERDRELSVKEIFEK